jgi:hypothetical protein
MDTAVSWCDLPSFQKATSPSHGHRYQWILMRRDCIPYHAQQALRAHWFCMGCSVYGFRGSWLVTCTRTAFIPPDPEGYSGCFLAANLMMRTRLPPKSQRPPAPPPDIKGIATDTAFQLSVAGYVSTSLAVVAPSHPSYRSFLVMLGLFLPFFYLQVRVQRSLKR